jgi:hypothetical protein
MISVYNSPFISYIGKNSDFKNEFEVIDSCDQFLNVILENIKLNSSLDILITCLDISEFKFSDKFISEIIDEESPIISYYIESINLFIAKRNTRILFYRKGIFSC